MAQKDLYLAITTDSENSGIDSRITVHRTSTKAISKIFESSVNLLEKVKIKSKTFEKDSYQIFDEDNNQYTGKIKRILVIDTPHLEAGPYPYTMDEIMVCFSHHSLLTNLLNQLVIQETRFEKEKQIKTLKEYINATEHSLEYAKSALETLTKANNLMWLSIDQTGDKLDLALFYNKDTAISYLSCRFEQALRKIGLQNDSKIIAKEKARYYTEKENFAKNNKMRYDLNNNTFISRGKVFCINIED